MEKLKINKLPLTRRRNEFVGQIARPKSRERDESRITTQICLLGADATATRKWQGDLNDNFDKVLGTEYAQI